MKSNIVLRLACVSVLIAGFATYLGVRAIVLRNAPACLAFCLIIAPISLAFTFFTSLLPSSRFYQKDRRQIDLVSLWLSGSAMAIVLVVAITAFVGGFFFGGS
jgi:hypothetical protein